jgi:hypothetical protein
MTFNKNNEESDGSVNDEPWIQWYVYFVVECIRMYESSIFPYSYSFLHFFDIF